MSTSALDHRLADVRRRLRLVLVTHGVSRVALVFVGSLAAVCVADWLVHFDDPVVRVILGLAILGWVAWVIRRHLFGPLTIDLSDSDLALRIEDRYPGFHDSLASSVQFASSGSDPKIGSPALQQAVVATTLERLRQLDCDDVIDAREVRRIAGMALAVCLAGALLAAVNPSLTTIALKRLLLPFSAAAWPKTTNLRLLSAELVPLEFDADRPLTIARGDTLKIMAENVTGRLPSRVTLEYRLADQKTSVEAMRPTTVNDSTGARREVAVGQLVAVRGDVMFRAVGGDDDQMPWHTLRVVLPPTVESLHVTLTPPAYTRRSAEKQPDGVGHVQSLIGTRVEFAAIANKPVARAVLRVQDQERRPVEVDSEGRQLSASFLVTDAGLRSWWLELQDFEGFEDAEPPRYEVRGLVDFEPEIYIDQPASDMQVTADAVVSVRTQARDDLGLKELRLVYRLEPSGSDEEHTITLLTTGDRPLALTAVHEWHIADLEPAAGARIVFHTEATDDFDLSAEFPEGKAPPLHVGRSVTRTLSIISSEEKAHEISQRQEGLLDDLERAFKLQEQAHDQVGDLLVQLRNAEKFRPEDVDSLQRTELGQRDVAAQLAGPATGIERRARDLADELANNQIDDAQTERRLSRIADEIARLRQQHLAPIEEELTQARKVVQSKPPGRGNDKNQTGARPDEALGQVADNQAAVLESLGEMLQDLSEWRGEHEATRELADLVRQQSDLNARASEVSRQTLTKPVESLAPQERADLAKIAERQKKHADQLDQLESRMRETVQGLEDKNPEAAGALKEALEQSRQEAISGQMRDAAGEIGENRMGQAERMQREVLQKLRDLEDTLRQKRESDAEMLVKRLEQAAEKLQDLHDRQEEVMRKLQNLEKKEASPDRQQALEELRKQQQALREETASLVRRLARHEAGAPEASARRAAGRMREAENQLADGDEAAAGQRQQEAIEDLEQAQRELARELREAREQLAREQLAKAADELAALVPRQQSIIDETLRLDELHGAAGKWSRAQLVSLQNVSKTQEALSEDAARIVEKLSAAEVFALALKGARGHMERALEMLNRRETGAETRRIEEAARKRIIDLVEALRPEEPVAGDAPPPDQPGGGGGGERPPQEGIPTLAQVKMLIALQKELAARTVEIERVRGKDGRLPVAAGEELDAIAREQGELADLARNLSALSPSNGDDDGENQKSDGGAEPAGK